MINAFMKYVKDITYINNDTILDANEGSIKIGKNSQPLSVKHLFSKLINNQNFNTTNQQDAGEGILLILQSINEIGKKRNFIDPFRFCSFSWREIKTCLKCHKVEELGTTEGNIVMVQAPQTVTFDRSKV